jgi:hypothetical protein
MRGRLFQRQGFRQALGHVAGGRLAPGNSIGTLIVAGNLNLALAVSNQTGALQFELGAPGTNDLVLVNSGTLTIGSGLLEFEDFQFTDAGATNGTYFLFATGNVIDGSLGAGTTGLIGGYQATLGLANGNKDLVLTVVPEPSAGLLTLLGMGLLAIRRPRVGRRCQTGGDPRSRGLRAWCRQADRDGGVGRHGHFEGELAGFAILARRAGVDVVRVFGYHARQWSEPSDQTTGTNSCERRLPASSSRRPQARNVQRPELAPMTSSRPRVNAETVSDVTVL